MNSTNRSEFIKGLRDGVPIGIGYLAVSFSLGITARECGFTALQGFIASITTIASAGEYLGFTLFAATATLLVFLLILILIAMIDLDTMEIPFSLNLAILGLGGLSILTFQWTEPFSQITIVNRIVGMLVISVPMILINLLVSGAFGGGDVKLMFAAGFLLGWKMIVSGFFMGAIVGGAVGITVMVRKKKGGKEHIPFGPSLCVGLYLAIMFGTQMIDWYIEILKRAMGK